MEYRARWQMIDDIVVSILHLLFKLIFLSHTDPKLVGIVLHRDDIIGLVS